MAKFENTPTARDARQPRVTDWDILPSGAVEFGDEPRDDLESAISRHPAGKNISYITATGADGVFTVADDGSLRRFPDEPLDPTKHSPEECALNEEDPRFSGITQHSGDKNTDFPRNGVKYTTDQD